jgi:hypothetical protein
MTGWWLRPDGGRSAERAIAQGGRGLGARRRGAGRQVGRPSGPDPAGLPRRVSARAISAHLFHKKHEKKRSDRRFFVLQVVKILF